MCCSQSPDKSTSCSDCKAKSVHSRDLFIYSSLRIGFHSEVFHYITQFFEFVTTAKVKGTLSILEGQPVAVPSTDSFIKGELYKLNREDDFSYVFGQLDDYEGLTADPGEQSSYRRELTTVYKDDGTVTEAWIYWYNGNVSGKPVIPSGDALAYLESKKPLGT